jgi:hypothetical protein
MSEKRESRPVSRLIVDGIEWKARMDDGKPTGDIKTYLEARRLTRAGRSGEAVKLYRDRGLGVIR